MQDPEPMNQADLFQELSSNINEVKKAGIFK